MAPLARALIASALLLAAIPPASAAEMASRYTRHAYESCPVRPGGGAEPGSSERVCVGVDGIAVAWSADDDSSLIAFPRERGEWPTIGSFFEAGTTIEWRGPAGGRASAAIVRYRVGDSVGRLDRSRLLVYRLGPDASCIMGIVDGARPGANAAARGIADAAPGFACGRGRRVVL